MHNAIKSAICVLLAALAGLADEGRPPASAPAVQPSVGSSPATGTTTSATSASASRSAVGIPASQAGQRRVHVFVSGKVQGVSYRAFTMQNAQRLGVFGWVRNLRDGRVEAVIEGKSGNVAKLLETMRRGPAAADVKGLEVQDEIPTGEFGNFEIHT
jgi:acylphosphatase